MVHFQRAFERAGHFAYRRFLPLVVAAYAAAALWPAAGQAAQRFALAALVPGVAAPALPLPAALLAALLFNAALAVDGRDLAGVARRPGVLAAGLLANLSVPLGLVLVAAVAARGWHDPLEAGHLLTGLALIAAMPVAGSSAAWAQRAGGNLALSLGLVVGSTALSPLTTPLALAAVGAASGAGPGDALRALAGGTGRFLVAFVAVPTALGLAAGRAAGADRVARWRPAMTAFGSAAVLALCYANASASLPGVVREADWDFLALVAAGAAGLCAAAFGSGRAVARCLRAGRAEERSLVYGLGMSNNGSGLALAASLALPAEAALPVLAYNLFQHLAAGYVGRAHA